MRRFIVIVVVIIAVSSAAASAATAEGAGARLARPARTVTLQRWVRSVCGGLSDWSDALDRLDTKIQKGLTDLDSGKLSPKAAKARLLRAATDETKTTDQLIAKVKQLGTPRATSGRSVAASFSDTLSDLRAAAVEQRRSYARLTTAERKTSSERAKAIETTIEKKGTEIGDPLEGPRGDQEFAAALTNEPACTDLLPSFTPTSFVVGDCLNGSSPDASLEEFEKVACSEKHLEEVFAITNHPAGPSDPYPGEVAINSFAEATCTPAFRAYVGVDIDASDFDYSYYTPDKDTWPVGDRQIVCAVDHEDGSPLRGSVNGTGAQ